MQLESMIRLYYTFIHITPFNGLIFYVFRRHLRFGAASYCTGLSLVALNGPEGAVQAGDTRS